MTDIARYAPHDDNAVLFTKLLQEQRGKIISALGMNTTHIAMISMHIRILTHMLSYPLSHSPSLSLAKTNWCIKKYFLIPIFDIHLLIKT